MDYIWVEKYRPKVIDDCILPDDIKNIFKAFKESGEIKNIVLSGNAGCGKTTVARALCNECNVEVLEINGSDENGIDVLRTKLKTFVTTASFESYKVVILDEADGLTSNMMDGLRNFIETYSKTCRFILTCNDVNKISSALLSRCVHIPFTFKKDDINKLKILMARKIQQILVKENKSEIDDKKDELKTLLKVVNLCFPDFRGAIQKVQVLGTSSFDELKKNIDDNPFNNLIDIIDTKDFTLAREWVHEHFRDGSSLLFTGIYNNVVKIFERESIIPAMMMINKYSADFNNHTNKELPLCCCICELFKFKIKK